jgi:hypothetical protein
MQFFPWQGSYHSDSIHQGMSLSVRDMVSVSEAEPFSL